MKNEAKQKKRTRTRYPEEYKKEALKLVERGGEIDGSEAMGRVRSAFVLLAQQDAAS